MEISRNIRPARTGGAVRVDQGLRINLEMGVRRGMDVGSLERFYDPPACPQQDAASFQRVRAKRGSAHGGEGLACHFDLHHAWP